MLKASQQQKTFCKLIKVNYNFAGIHPIEERFISRPLLRQFNPTSITIQIHKQAAGLQSADKEKERKLLKKIRDKLS